MRHSATRTIRLQLIEAMERRAAGHEGEARTILDEKRSRLVDAHGGDQAVATARHASGAEAAAAPARGALGQLVDQHAGHATFPELPALDVFRQVWSRLRSETQLRQTLEYVPENAGPLNSSALVHRSIELMRELSPEYLRQFLSYVDDLSSLERIAASGATTDKDALRPASIGKRAGSKPRTRRK